MIKVTDKQIHEAQEQYFGKRYVGACMSKCEYSYENSQRLHKWMGKPSGFLVLYGEPGVSKTYMMAAMVDWLLKRGSSLWAEGRDGEKWQLPTDFRIMRETDFFSYMRKKIAEFSNVEYQDLVNKLAESDYFFMDDLGTSQGTEWQKEVMFAFLDTRFSSAKPTVITTNLHPKAVGEHYDHRIISRLFSKDNVILHIEGHDWREPQL